jgi:hypothetical protein
MLAHDTPSRHRSRMRIEHRRGITRAATVALLFLAGCLDGITAVKLSDLVGNWNLVHLNRKSVSTGDIADAMAGGGTTVVMTVASDGTVTTVSTIGSYPPVNGGGAILVSGNSTKLTLDGIDFYGTIVLKGAELTIDCGPTVGLEEFSRITFVFNRQ